MKRAPIRRLVWLLLTAIGFALMNVALFLHPMSPEDFLDAALSNPWQSVVDTQGGGMAVFFWASASLTIFTALRFLAVANLLQRLFHHPKQATRLAH
jgi:hypothetical protein